MCVCSDIGMCYTVCIFEQEYILIRCYQEVSLAGVTIKMLYFTCTSASESRSFTRSKILVHVLQEFGFGRNARLIKSQLYLDGFDWHGLSNNIKSELHVLFGQCGNVFTTPKAEMKLILQCAYM